MRSFSFLCFLVVFFGMDLYANLARLPERPIYLASPPLVVEPMTLEWEEHVAAMQPPVVECQAELTREFIGPVVIDMRLVVDVCCPDVTLLALNFVQPPPGGGPLVTRNVRFTTDDGVVHTTVLTPYGSEFVRMRIDCPETPVIPSSRTVTVEYSEDGGTTWAGGVVWKVECLDVECQPWTP